MILQNIDLLIVFCTSVAVCALILMTSHLYMPLIMRRADQGAIQAAHCKPTPRIGGLALIASLIPMMLLLPEPLDDKFGLFILSLLPIVAAGLAEDFGYRVRPRWRLFAAAFSSLMAILLLEVALPRTEIPGLDHLMVWFPFAAAFTIFACTGICNAFNLIDGLNGLAAGNGVVAALGLALIAVEAGHPNMAHLNLMLIAALMGFLVFNYPYGKIFLGDAGAYALGHLLAWFSIALLLRSPDLSSWAVALIIFWPVADTFFAIYRRLRSGRPTGQPDRLHYHQLVMRALEIAVTGRRKRSIANPLATFVMLPLFGSPVIAGVLLWDKPLAAFLTFCGFGMMFVMSYLLGLRWARHQRLPLGGLQPRRSSVPPLHLARQQGEGEKA